jgi:hypothetical protein
MKMSCGLGSLLSYKTLVIQTINQWIKFLFPTFVCPAVGRRGGTPVMFVDRGSTSVLKKSYAKHQNRYAKNRAAMKFLRDNLILFSFSDLFRLDFHRRSHILR